MVRYRNPGTQVFEDSEHEAVNTGDITIDGNSILNPGDIIYPRAVSVDDTVTFTQTGFSDTGMYPSVGMYMDNIPSDLTLYGRFICRLKNDTGGETTSAYPELFESDVTTKRGLFELEVTVTGDEIIADSGWKEITTTINSDVVVLRDINGRVTAGTGKVQGPYLAFGGKL